MGYGCIAVAEWGRGRSLVLRLLSRRIGAIAPIAKAKISALSVSELEVLDEALLDFSSPADLDERLRSRSVSAEESH
jgi:Domain of unknown function (DUF4351)